MMAPYHMQKSECEIHDPDVIQDILQHGQYLTLALCRHDEPYVLTLSYGYDAAQNALYFHTAPQGLKIAFIRENPSVCGTIVEDQGYKQGECAHAYRSVVFRGQVEILEDVAEKQHGLHVLIDHLEDDPSVMKKRLLTRENVYQRTAILRVKIQDISGKAGQ
jgi:hypothetical protein